MSEGLSISRVKLYLLTTSLEVFIIEFLKALVKEPIFVCEFIISAKVSLSSSLISFTYVLIILIIEAKLASKLSIELCKALHNSWVKESDPPIGDDIVFWIVVLIESNDFFNSLKLLLVGSLSTKSSI